MAGMTPDLLRAAVGCSAALAERYAAPLTDACRVFGIDTPQRMAAFLAQISHESGSLRYVREIWGPTAAQQRYEGRADLGNTEPGDGQRYLGRGLIQLTGRANARQARDELRKLLGPEIPDFEAEPERLEEPGWEALVAAWFWASRGCNELADAGNFETITRKINGGLNGYADRLARWSAAKAALGAGSATRAQAAGPVTDDDMREAHALIASPKEPNMPIPAIVGALLPVLSSAVPELAKLLKPDSKSAEKNATIAAKAFEVAQTALGAVNAQEVAERIQCDPAAAQAVRQAVQERWYELAEVGGGIQAAREADTASAIAGLRAWHSPSFWALLLLMPLVYMLVGSISGLWGYDQWSDDVRAAISTAVVSLVVGGAAGYYWGSTTTRNKLGAQA